MKKIKLLQISLIALILAPAVILGHAKSWNRITVTAKPQNTRVEIEIDKDNLISQYTIISRDGSVDWLSRSDSLRALVTEGIVFTDGSQKRLHLRNVTIDSSDTDNLGLLTMTASLPAPPECSLLTVRAELFPDSHAPVHWMYAFRDSAAQTVLHSTGTNGEPLRYSFKQRALVDSGGNIEQSASPDTWYTRALRTVRLGFSQAGVEQLFAGSDHTPFMPLYLLLAVIIGALHALSPGHGKALIGAYIVSSRGSVRDAILLGVVTTISHTASVLLLGIILLTIFGPVLPEGVIPYISIASGILIIGIGGWLLAKRLQELKGAEPHGHSHDHHSHDHHSHDHHSHDHHSHDHHAHDHHAHEHHHHDHDHGHGHEHVSLETIQKKGFWQSIAMGVSGGMVPCPAALVILFVAISLKQLVLGLTLILFFSIGLAISLSVIGIVFSRGVKYAEKYDRSNIIPKLPVLSAVIIIILGGAIALNGAGFFQ
ncbi:MAG: sulfite exporter TauE/SafE family protein [Fibrobacterota bacterium]